MGKSSDSETEILRTTAIPGDEIPSGDVRVGPSSSPVGTAGSSGDLRPSAQEPPVQESAQEPVGGPSWRQLPNSDMQYHVLYEADVLHDTGTGFSFGLGRAGKGKSNRLHSHAEAELYFVLQGEGLMEYAGTVEEREEGENGGTPSAREEAEGEVAAVAGDERSHEPLKTTPGKELVRNNEVDLRNDAELAPKDGRPVVRNQRSPALLSVPSPSQLSSVYPPRRTPLSPQATPNLLPPPNSPVAPGVACRPRRRTEMASPAISVRSDSPVKTVRSPTSSFIADDDSSTTVISGTTAASVDLKYAHLEPGRLVYLPGHMPHRVQATSEQDFVFLFMFPTSRFSNVRYNFLEGSPGAFSKSASKLKLQSLPLHDSLGQNSLFNYDFGHGLSVQRLVAEDDVEIRAPENGVLAAYVLPQLPTRTLQTSAPNEDDGVSAPNENNETALTSTTSFTVLRDGAREKLRPADFGRDALDLLCLVMDGPVCPPCEEMGML